MLIAICLIILLILIGVFLKPKNKSVPEEDKTKRDEKMNEDDCTYWDDLTK